MLKAIGLNAQELRRIDPAEALQRVAVALNRYSDDGNKARIVQELFGKSVREVAPFMKDPAEAASSTPPSRPSRPRRRRSSTSNCSRCRRTRRIRLAPY